MNSRIRAIFGATAMIAAFGLSACSTDSGTEKTEVSAPAGDPIKLGTICSCTGVPAASSGTTDEILQAWADEVNDGGGLNGYRIELVIKDDGGVPERALQAAKELVEEDKVVALVGAVGSQTAAYQQYVEDKGVPVVGGFPTEAPFSSSPMFFISGAGAAVTAVGQYTQVAEAGLKKAGVTYCSEAPICAKADALGAVAAPLNGIDYTSTKIAATQPNYTAQCAAFKEEEVDALFIVHNTEVLPRVLGDCANVSYSPTYIGSATTFGPTIAKDPAFDGSIWNGTNANYLDESVPGIKRMHDALKAYAPDVLESNQFTPVAANSYYGGLLFEAASAAFGGFTPESTSADILTGLYKLQDETLDGTAPPLTFTKGQPAFPVCYFEMKLADGELTSENDGKPTCLDEAVVGQLQELLAAAG